MTEAVDHEARQHAERAIERLKAHETLCAERWRSAHGLLDVLCKRWWWLLTSMLLGMAGIIAKQWGVI